MTARFDSACDQNPETSGLACLVDDLALACLGGGLPAEAEQELSLAGQYFSEYDVALGHLQKAWEIAPDHAAVYIGLYRFYFYTHRLREALDVAERCLAKAARDNGFKGDWRSVQRGDADFVRFDALLPRFFLFTLKGYAYLNLRLGQLDAGREAMEKLLELDPANRMGGQVLREVLERMGCDDED
ncbi:MAG: tetratricopeptide repeat protein [Methylococcaceae bacterium]